MEVKEGGTKSGQQPKGTVVEKGRTDTMRPKEKLFVIHPGEMQPTARKHIPQGFMYEYGVSLTRSLLQSRHSGAQ
jgi:hypothetical protein